MSKSNKTTLYVRSVKAVNIEWIKKKVKDSCDYKRAADLINAILDKARKDDRVN